jgi:hypothetical protein
MEERSREPVVDEKFRGRCIEITARVGTINRKFVDSRGRSIGQIRGDKQSCYGGAGEQGAHLIAVIAFETTQWRQQGFETCG